MANGKPETAIGQQVVKRLESDALAKDGLEANGHKPSNGMTALSSRQDDEAACGRKRMSG